MNVYIRYVWGGLASGIVGLITLMVIHENSSMTYIIQTLFLILDVIICYLVLMNRVDLYSSQQCLETIYGDSDGINQLPDKLKGIYYAKSSECM